MDLQTHPWTIHYFKLTLLLSGPLNLNMISQDQGLTEAQLLHWSLARSTSTVQIARGGSVQPYSCSTESSSEYDLNHQEEKPSQEHFQDSIKPYLIVPYLIVPYPIVPYPIMGVRQA